jgi:hypothetical protein
MRISADQPLQQLTAPLRIPFDFPQRPFQMAIWRELPLQHLGAQQYRGHQATKLVEILVPLCSEQLRGARRIARVPLAVTAGGDRRFRTLTRQVQVWREIMRPVRHNRRATLTGSLHCQAIGGAVARRRRRYRTLVILSAASRSVLQFSWHRHPVILGPCVGRSSNMHMKRQLH